MIIKFTDLDENKVVYRLAQSAYSAKKASHFANSERLDAYDDIVPEKAKPLYKSLTSLANFEALIA